jgi:HlyD family secretion protein
VWPKFLIAGAIAAVVIGVAGWFTIKWLRAARLRDAVITAEVVRGDLPIAVVERGELESAQSVEVRCEPEGKEFKLVSILPEGTPVKKNQEVGRLDTDAIDKLIAEQQVKSEQADGKARAAKAELEVQENKAKSEIAKADLNAQLAELDLEKYDKAEYAADYNEKKGAIDLAQKELEEANSNLKFTERLVTRGLAQMEQKKLKEMEVNQKEYIVKRDQAKLLVLEYDKRRKLTEFKYKAEDTKLELERTKKSSQASTDKARSESEAAEKTAKLERYQLDKLQAQRVKYTIKAPEDGIMVYFKRPWDETARIQPGAMVYSQQSIFTLPDLDHMKVKVKIHESVIKKVKLGLPVTITVDALGPSITMHGTVKTVATLAQSEWRSSVKEYVTEVSIDDLPENGGLKPGMSGEVRILIETRSEVLLVPVQAVTERDGKHYAYVMNRIGADRREVKIGEANEQFVQVTEGLSEGESVALDARARAAAEAKKSSDKK